MARDKGQVFVFNEAELKLIQATFADNEALIYSIRKVLLQFPLTAPEKELVKQSMTPEVYAVVKKKIYPEIDPDAPLTQLSDYRSLLTQDLKTKSTADLRVVLKARQTEIDYLHQQMEALKDVDVEQKGGIRLADLRSNLTTSPSLIEDTHADLMAYLNLLGYIDPQLQLLKVIAGTKEETIEQKRNRMTKDSSR